MKKIYLFMLLMVLGAGAAFAQGKTNVVIFSEDGEPFFVFINGVRQNGNAETNVRVTDLTTESFHFKVVFANSANEPISKNQYLPFGNEYTFKIKKAKKGYKLAPFGQVELAQSTSSAPSYSYTTTESTPTATQVNGNGTGNSTVSTNNGTENTMVTTGATINGETTTTETVTTTTTTTTGTNGQEQISTGTNTGSGSVSFNMNVSENGMNMNMGVSESGNGGNMNTGMNVNGGSTGGTVSSNSSSVTTTTTTYSTTTTSSGTGTNATYVNNDQNSNVSSNTNTSYTQPSVGCSYPMSDADFSSMKKSVESKSFEDTKMSTAKQATKNNCMSSKQVAQIMTLFMMDDEKLEYAKYAYDYTTDKKDFYKVSESFSFDSTTEEFNKWLDAK